LFTLDNNISFIDICRFGKTLWIGYRISLSPYVFGSQTSKPR
jgi:hypothetical protein